MKGLFDIIGSYFWWILLGLFVCLFAYLGYYADKHGHLGKKRKAKSNNTLVDIDSLIKPKEEKINEVKNDSEDLSSSFDVMPEVQTEQKANTKEAEIMNEIPEELFAPFGDQHVDNRGASQNITEVVDENHQQEFDKIDEIEKNAKDIYDDSDKKDVSELMKGEEKIDMNFEVEGTSEETKDDNVFANNKKGKEKDKNNEEIDEMWKF